MEGSGGRWRQVDKCEGSELWFIIIIFKSFPEAERDHAFKNPHEWAKRRFWSWFCCQKLANSQEHSTAHGNGPALRNEEELLRMLL